MAIETTSTGATVITGEHIGLYRLLMLKQAMQFEVKHGMKMSRINPFPIVRKEFGITARKKEDVLEQYLAILRESGINV